MSKMTDFVECFRRNAKESDYLRDYGLEVPEDIECIYNLQYMGDDEWNRLDIYKPLGSDEKLPVIINCHGGGLIYGDKELYRFYCMSLAQRGFAVVNFSYHLAPESDFYTQLSEVNEVVHFTLDNADKYGIDKNNVFIAGDSAGATLAGCYINICTNKAYATRFSFAVPKGFVPNAALLNCGWFSSRVGDFEIYEAALGPDYESRLDDIDVIKNITADFPPCYIATASEDFLRESCYELCYALNALGCEVEFKEYLSAQEKLGHCFQTDMKSAYAHICNSEECDFLRKYIKNL